jgi:hypothetical protein
VEEAQRQEFLLTYIRTHPEGRTLTRTEQQRAAEIAEKHFTGLNWQAAGQQGIEEARYGTFFSKPRK